MPAEATHTRPMCPRHHASPRRVTCGDCGIAMCDDCAVVVPSLGFFCWECTSRRGGLQHRPRRTAVGTATDPRLLHWWRRRGA